MSFLTKVNKFDDTTVSDEKIVTFDISVHNVVLM